MSQPPNSRDGFDSTIPVFPTAQIKKEVLDDFFRQANEACFKCEYTEPMGTLMHANELEKLQPHTPSPVDDNLLPQWPFLGWTVQDIVHFALERLNGSDFSPANMVILDEQTNQDSTAMLLAYDYLTKHNELKDSATPDDYLLVRSDFESAIVTLKTIETACGGVEQIDTNYRGSDGVLRISIRDQQQ